MKQAKKAIISASLLVAISVAAGTAWAQGDDAMMASTEAEAEMGDQGADEDSGEARFDADAVLENGEGPATDCPEGETCTDDTGTGGQEPVSDDAGLAAPTQVTDPDSSPSDTPVLTTPGSTGDDGAGGGSGRPGTTPDT